jgi:hypothetical protein
MTKRTKNESIVVLFKSAEEAAAMAESAKAAGFEVGAVRELNFASPEQIIVGWARKGDWDVLADYISAGNRITNEMREFLSAVLRRKVNRPNNRAPRLRTIFGEAGLMHRVGFFLSLLDRGIQRDSAITQTAENFGIDRRTIQRNIEECEDAVKILLLAQRHALHHAYHRASMRYAVSLTALSQHFMS